MRDSGGTCEAPSRSLRHSPTPAHRFPKGFENAWLPRILNRIEMTPRFRHSSVRERGGGFAGGRAREKGAQLENNTRRSGPLDWAVPSGCAIAFSLGSVAPPRLSSLDRSLPPSLTSQDSFACEFLWGGMGSVLNQQYPTGARKSGDEPGKLPEQEEEEEEEEEEKSQVLHGTGHCKWFNVRMGFGFISMLNREGSPLESPVDVFVHQVTI
ncbi:protein lin-28 B like [Crotalus adamanteus]|uniref:Protein lin-28 B like n=1 Tax=Crotalus adamanteus TaxID=8729 RepID=A0AAW1CAT4_CROAD